MEEEFKVVTTDVPRPGPRKRLGLGRTGTNPLVNQAVDNILGTKPKLVVAAFQSSI